MLPEERLADYFAGVLSPEESAAVEAEILVNRDSLRELCVQQQVDAALKALLDPGKAQLEAAILASVHGLSNEAVEARVLAQTVRTPSVDAGAQAGRGAKRGRTGTGIGARKSGPGWWGWLGWGLAGGLVLLVLGLVGLWWSGRLGGSKTGAEMASRCVVKELLDCRWAANSFQPKSGQVLATNSLVLESGVVQLEFDTGVEAVIEGPARLKLTGQNAVVLNEGKLTAKVPKPAAGFAVRMPKATAVDLGTRLGTWVQADGKMETDVFVGRVELRIGSGKKDARRQELTNDMAMAVEPDGKVTSLAANPARFPQPAEALRIWPSNCGFESAELLKLEGMPGDYYFWSGDACAVTEQMLGVRPQAENRMLRFLSPSVVAREGGVPGDSAVWQLIDLKPYKAAFGSEASVMMHLSAEFNRIRCDSSAGDTFGVTLAAFRGQPDQAGKLWARRKEMAVALASQQSVTDNDPQTWEKIETRVNVPVEADFLIVELRAIAPPGPAATSGLFPGHFADSVMLQMDAPLRASVSSKP